MDFERLLGILIALLWLLGPLLRRRQKQQPAPGETSAPPVLSPARLAGRVADQLSTLEAEAQRARDTLDPATASRLAPWLDEQLLPGLRSGRERLSALAEAGALATVIEEVESAQRRLTAQGEAVMAMRALAARRADPGLAPLHGAGDRLAAELYEPFAAFALRVAGGLEIGPPVAVVWESRADEPLARAPFAAALLPVPRAARFQAWLWPSLGQSFGRYLQAAVPELRPEMHAALELDLREPPGGAESPELARLLLGAWSATLLADVVGALIFGPAYLRMLVRAFAEEDPQAVTTIALGRGGQVRPEPPPHLRVHVVGHWVAQMGYESTALERLRTWDTAHQDPDRLQLRGPGGVGTIPVGPLLANLEALVDRLDAHSFACLGNTKLSDVPGLAGWSGLSATARLAERALASGTPFAAPARALMAGATAAAIASPQQAAVIDRVLHESLSGAVPRRRREVRAASGTGRARPTRRLSPRRLSEALLLGDLLLQRRARAAHPPFVGSRPIRSQRS